jgi:hypothetical protein
MSPPVTLQKIRRAATAAATPVVVWKEEDVKQTHVAAPGPAGDAKETRLVEANRLYHYCN